MFSFGSLYYDPIIDCQTEIEWGTTTKNKKQQKKTTKFTLCVFFKCGLNERGAPGFGNLTN